MFSVSASAEFYKYTDEDGNVRFTDDINQVPEEQRSKIRSYVESQSEEVSEQEATQEIPEKSEQPANFPDSSEDDAEQGSIEELKSRIDVIKQEIDQAYAALLKEKEQLSEDKNKVKTRAQVESYNKRIESYNIRGEDFIKKQKERDALIDDYNARITKKNTKAQTSSDWIFKARLRRLNFKKNYHKNDGATRGASACAARATSLNIQYSIFNSQFPPHPFYPLNSWLETSLCPK